MIALFNILKVVLTAFAILLLLIALIRFATLLQEELIALGLFLAFFMSIYEPRKGI